MKGYLMIPRRSIGYVLAVLAASGLMLVGFAQSNTDSGARVIASGGGTTMVEGGTGSPGFIPVLTKIGFHAEKKGGVVTGGFECLALAPAVAAGPGSANFIVNAMYVTGTIKTAAVSGDTATLTGTATITGLGAGSNVPFQFVVRRGGLALRWY